MPDLSAALRCVDVSKFCRLLAASGAIQYHLRWGRWDLACFENSPHTVLNDKDFGRNCLPWKAARVWFWGCSMVAVLFLPLLPRHLVVLLTPLCAGLFLCFLVLWNPLSSIGTNGNFGCCVLMQRISSADFGNCWRSSWMNRLPPTVELVRSLIIAGHRRPLDVHVELQFQVRRPVKGEMSVDISEVMKRWCTSSCGRVVTMMVRSRPDRRKTPKRSSKDALLRSYTYRH